MNTPTDLHTQAITAFERALAAEFEAFNQWALDPDFEDKNKRAYEKANQYRKAVMGRTGAAQHVES